MINRYNRKTYATDHKTRHDFQRLSRFVRKHTQDVQRLSRFARKHSLRCPKTHDLQESIHKMFKDCYGLQESIHNMSKDCHGLQESIHTQRALCVFMHTETRTDLEVVEALELASHRVQFLVVRLLDLAESLRHLALPELTVLGRCVAVGESSQLLHLLRAKTRQAFMNKFVKSSINFSFYY